jgi:hypothetical protein
MRMRMVMGWTARRRRGLSVARAAAAIGVDSVLTRTVDSIPNARVRMAYLRMCDGISAHHRFNGCSVDSLENSTARIFFRTPP